MREIVKVVMGIIGVFIGLVLFPTIIDQANTLWTAAGTTYTGLQSLVAIAPLVIYVGLIAGSIFISSQGAVSLVRKRRTRRGRY